MCLGGRTGCEIRGRGLGFGAPPNGSWWIFFLFLWRIESDRFPRDGRGRAVRRGAEGRGHVAGRGDTTRRPFGRGHVAGGKVLPHGGRAVRGLF